jgi:hypothetical protein
VYKWFVATGAGATVNLYPDTYATAVLDGNAQLVVSHCWSGSKQASATTTSILDASNSVVTSVPAVPWCATGRQ